MSSQAQTDNWAPGASSISSHSQERATAYYYENDIFVLVEKLLRQEQQSKLYQRHLESRIHNDSTAYERIRGQCIQLERMVSGLVHTKSQSETSLRSAAEACQAMSRDLSLEKNKVQELESRLSEVYPQIEAFLQYLSQSENSHDSRDETWRVQQLQQENQRQRELIACLQSTLQTREEMVQELKGVLEQAAGELPRSKNSPMVPDNSTSSGTPSSWLDDESSVEIITGRAVSVVHRTD